MLNLDPERRFGELPLEARHSICLEISKKKRQSVSASIFLPKDYARKFRLRRCNNNNNNYNNKKEKEKSNINHKTKQNANTEVRTKQQIESTLKKIRKLTKMSSKKSINKPTKEDFMDMANSKHPEYFQLGRSTYDNEHVRDVMEQLKRVSETNTRAIQTECSVEQQEEEQQTTGSLSYQGENSPLPAALEEQQQQRITITNMKQEVLSDDECMSQYYELEKVSYNEASDSVEMIYKMPTTATTTLTTERTTTDNNSNAIELTTNNDQQIDEHWQIGTFIPVTIATTTTTSSTICEHNTNEWRKENDLLLTRETEVVPLPLEKATPNVNQLLHTCAQCASKRDKEIHTWHRPNPYAYYTANFPAHESLNIVTRPTRVNSPSHAAYEFTHSVTPSLTCTQPQTIEPTYTLTRTTTYDQLTPPPSTDERLINIASNFTHSHPFLTPPPTVDTYNMPMDLTVTHQQQPQQQQRHTQTQQQHQQTYALTKLQQKHRQKTRNHSMPKKQRQQQQIEPLPYNATRMLPKATTTTRTANSNLYATYNSLQPPNRPPPMPPQPPAAAVPPHHYNNNLSYYNLPHAAYPAPYRYPPIQTRPLPPPYAAAWPGTIAYKPTQSQAITPTINPLQQQQQLYEISSQKLQQQLHIQQLQQLQQHLQRQQLQPPERIQQEPIQLQQQLQHKLSQLQQQQQQQQQQQHALLQLSQYAEPTRLQQQQEELIRLQQQHQETTPRQQQQQQQQTNMRLQEQQQHESHLHLQQQQTLLRLPQQPPATHLRLHQQQQHQLSTHSNLNSHETQNLHNNPVIFPYIAYDKTRWCYT